jgi:hypothetical protein
VEVWKWAGGGRADGGWMAGVGGAGGGGDGGKEGPGAAAWHQVTGRGCALE